MARNRLTWQSVTGPQNQASTIAAMAASGRQFNTALTGLSDGLKDFGRGLEQDRIDGAKAVVDARSAQAMNAIMEIQDPASWSAMMANGGLSSLGFDPTQVNPAVLTAMSNRRGDLQKRRSDDLEFMDDKLEYNSDQHNFNVTKQNYGRSEEEYALGEWARENITPYITGTKTIEDGKLSISNDKDLSEKERTALLAEFETRSTGRYDPDSDATAALAEHEDFNTALSIHQQKGAMLREAMSLNPDLQTYAKFRDGGLTEINTEADAILYLTNKFSGFDFKPGDGRLDTVLGQAISAAERTDSNGNVQRLPLGLIVSIMEDSLDGQSRILPGTAGVQFNKGLFTDEVGSRIKAFMESMNALESEYTQYSTEANQLNKTQKSLEEFGRDYALAHTRENPQFMRDASKDLSKILESMGLETRDPSVNVGNIPSGFGTGTGPTGSNVNVPNTAGDILNTVVSSQGKAPQGPSALPSVDNTYSTGFPRSSFGSPVTAGGNPRPKPKRNSDGVSETLVKIGYETPEGQKATSLIKEVNSMVDNPDNKLPEPVLQRLIELGEERDAGKISSIDYLAEYTNIIERQKMMGAYNLMDLK
jgi:hypothetical protein